MTYKVLISVPTLVSIDFANSVNAAMAGALKIVGEMPEIGGHKPKIMELHGPTDSILEWGKVAVSEREAAEKRKSKHDHMFTDDDPPPMQA